MQLSVKAYECLITKVVADWLLNRLDNGFYQLKLYVYAKGEDIESLTILYIVKERDEHNLSDFFKTHACDFLINTLSSIASTEIVLF